jgi:hypothetical protein
MRANRTIHRLPAWCVGLVLLLIASLTAPAEAMAQASCTRQVNVARPGERVDPPIKLTPTTQSAQRQLNFDTERDPKVISRIVVTADQALPSGVMPDQLGYDAVLSRTGETLESADFPTPKFTEPVIRQDRRTIIFSACLDPGDAEAGKYVGLVELNGPDGVSPTSVAVTVNLKDGTLFWPGFLAALAIAFVLLLIKDAAVAQPAVAKAAADAAKKAADGAKAAADASGAPDETKKAVAKAADDAAAAASGKSHWGRAFIVPLRDPRWWAASVVALGSAGGVIYAAFANDPAWGATGLTAVASLVGLAFAAIGGQTILRSFAPK